MPIDLEYLLSSSNHSFFPYSSFGNNDYHSSSCDHRLPLSQHCCAPGSSIKPQELFQKKTSNDDFAGSPPYCLVNRVSTTQDLYSTRKKKVSFADDRGFKLVEVREIPGAPKWADDVITLLIGNLKRTVVREKKWKTVFKHPPWPDEKLIDKLEKNMVSLEYVSIKEGTDDFLIGAIKVKNLAFEKNVFLRITFDRWLSYIDIPCTYIEPIKESVKLMIYDTFYFSSKILPIASRYEVVEFCICFKCDGKEYWDNNSGVNYRVTAEYVKHGIPDLHQPNISATSYKESFLDSTESVDGVFI